MARFAAPVVVAAAVAVLASCAAAKHTVRGTVYGADGEPRAACAITVGVISGGPIPEIALVSATNGSYEWTVPAGEYELSAFCPSGEQGAITVDATRTDVDKADIQVNGV